MLRAVKRASAAGHVRSPLEYRACFVQSGTRWRMTALEVGE
jgi:hypothetical protein